jgi:hypothetical protein
LQDELTTRRGELQDLEDSFRVEQQRGGNQEKAGQRDEAISEAMRTQVKSILQDRIPVMADIPEEEEGGAASQGGPKAAEDTGGAKREHYTVLVSYISFNQDGRLDDFKACFRIDKEITVRQLHDDACKYWGCSPKSFGLCKVEGADDVKSLMLNDNGEIDKEKMDTKVQYNQVLSLLEESHLHLIRHESLEQFKIARKKKMEEDAKKGSDPAKAPEAAAEKGTLKTLKGAEGGVVASEKVDEPFVEALKPWPGIYELLKTKRHTHDRKPRIIKFRDVVLYGLLGILSIYCIALRNETSWFIATEGVLENLVRGKVGQTSDPMGAVVDFDNIRSVQDVWTWLGGSFHYQLFNNASSMRTYYTPVGFVRLRQQKAAMRKECIRSGLPSHVKRQCYDVHVTEEAQDKTDLIFPPGVFLNFSDENNGRMHWPDPTLWNPSPAGESIQYGWMQRGYGASGYMIDYMLNEDNITVAGDTFLADLDKLRELWFSTETRMLAVELMLANYHVRAHVTMSFLIEISPSGGVGVSNTIIPFHMKDTAADAAARTIDWLRAFIVIPYIFIIKVYFETKRKVGRGKTGLGYVFSFSGFNDASIVAVFFALMYIRNLAGPPPANEMQSFFSYRRTGVLDRRLFTTESFLFLLIMVKFASLMRIFPPIFRFWKMFAFSIKMFIYLSMLFMPVLLGVVVLANAIWNPYLLQVSTWTETLVLVLNSIRQGLPVEELYKKDRDWTIPFMLYFFFSLSGFFLHSFLAVSVHSYFEVELLEGDVLGDDGWSVDQWMDWMLIGKVYQILTGREPGSCQRDDVGEDEDDDEDDEDDDDGGD